MEERSRLRDGRLTGNVMLVVVATALVSGFSHDAQGRTQNDVDCLDDVPGADTESLQIRRIDHMPLPSVPEASPVSGDAGDEGDPATPLLDLTPRAESTLRDVFDTAADTSLTASPQDLPVSPIAERDEDIPDISELPDNITPVAPLDPEIDLPLLHRQMFRTDI